MKVLFIGGGILSDRLKAAAPSGASVRVFGIRGLASSAELRNEMLEIAVASDLIVYIAYHHSDIRANCLTLVRLLAGLKAKGWRGRFVFFNTQSSISGSIMSSSLRPPAVLSCDLYSFTKRLQSRILRYYSGSLEISELYLPVVIGDGTKAQERFRFISSHAAVGVPMRGANSFAYLELDAFSGWIWGRFSRPRAGHENPVLERLFVYQGMRTFSDMLKAARPRSELAPLEFEDCRHRFPYDESARNNLVWCLKLSPLGLLANVVRGMRSVLVSPVTPTAQAVPSGKFVPVGPEYQFYGMTLDLGAIPFGKERVA